MKPGQKPRALSGVFVMRPLELAVWLVIAGVLATGAIFHARDGAAVSIALARVDVNAASPELLMTLPGMSTRRANAIVRERQKRGGFKRTAELADVRGMTEAYVRRIDELIELK